MSPISKFTSLRAQYRSLLERAGDALMLRFDEAQERTPAGLPSITEEEYRALNVILRGFREASDEIDSAPPVQAVEAPLPSLKLVTSDALDRLIRAAEEAQVS